MALVTSPPEAIATTEEDECNALRCRNSVDIACGPSLSPVLGRESKLGDSKDDLAFIDGTPGLVAVVVGCVAFC